MSEARVEARIGARRVVPRAPHAGALAWGGPSADGAIVVISVALPTLAVHALAVASRVSVSALLARAASGIRVVLGAVLRGLPATPRAPWVQATLVVGRARAQVCTRELTGRHLDRGPPAPA